MRVQYRVALTPDAASARLRERVDPVSLRYVLAPGLTTGGRFVGTVTSSGFDVRVRQRGTQTLAPHAVGVIRPTEAGSEIDASIGVGAAIRHALALLIGLIGVLLTPAELSAAVPGPIVVPIAGACVILAVIVWRRGGDDIGFPSSEAQQLRELLNATFEQTADAR